MSIDLQVENTSTCNAACTFCVYPQEKRWGGLMARDLYDKIVDEASSIPLISAFIITGLGEPTLDARLPDLVRYARSKLGKRRISVYTNGVYLRPQMFDALRDAGLTSIMVSLNAVRADQHDAVMGLKGKFDQVCQNIDYAIANAGDVRVEVRAVVVESQWTKDDVDRFYDRWGPALADGHGLLIHEGNWAGEFQTVRKFTPNEWCHRSTQTIYVLYDGTVSACCFDPTAKMNFGNLTTQTLRDVYSSPRYVQFRDDHVKDRADVYDICRTCTRI